jgi:hypothetical protein
MRVSSAVNRGTSAAAACLSPTPCNRRRACWCSRLSPRPWLRKGQCAEGATGGHRIWHA